MLRRISATLMCATSAGASAWIGRQYEQFRNDQETLVLRDNSLLNNLFHFVQNSTTVFAASVISHNRNIESMELDTYKSSEPVNHTAEIMKYGFPSLDNLLSYDGHVLAYDRRNRVPHWVFERLTADSVKYTKNNDRSQFDFEEDQAIHPYFRSSNEDFKGSGYDRGHLAAAANHRASNRAQGQTFFLSNIAPQVGKGFNRHAWNELEKYIRGLTKSFTHVYVCTGPLYLPRRDPSNGKLFVTYQVIGRNQVAVPTHFFKVVVCESSSHELHLLSYVLPNEKLPEDIDINRFLVPLESVQRASGLLMFDQIGSNRFKTVNGRKML